MSVARGRDASTASRGAMLALVLAAGCAAHEAAFPSSAGGALRVSGAHGRADPTIRGARLIPNAVDEKVTYGVEPGGGVRVLVSGARVVVGPGGAVEATADRLPRAVTAVLVLPERLGGGFLFQMGQAFWRSDRWLDPAAFAFSATSTTPRAFAGLDRIYVKGGTGAFEAYDARTGERLDLGPWPSSPVVGDYAALDGWRAVAIADLRGVVATLDAGATWKPLGLQMDAREVVVIGDSIAISGTDVDHRKTWYELRGDGHVARLSEPPEPGAHPPARPGEVAGRALGKRPLEAAIEDGWPLDDDTAIVARDGVLARVRLSDGAIVETANDAYPLSSSRCHPLPLPVADDAGAFGFLCGEPRGRTVLYRYDAASGRMVELRAFDRPRAVFASGSGAIAVQGACAADAEAENSDPSEQSYCLVPRGSLGAAREVVVRGDNPRSARVALMASGEFVVLSPPSFRDLTKARLTVQVDGTSRTIPLIFSSVPPEAHRVLEAGTWMNGLEERAPDVLGGWVELEGAMLGIQITLDGHVRTGRYIREGGRPVVSGRYGFGFTGSGTGFETTDGGMAWKEVDLPAPIVSDPYKVPVRACGPIGCIAAGWMRVGWGEPVRPAAAPVRPRDVVPAYRSPPELSLACEAAAGPPPEPLKAAPKRAQRPRPPPSPVPPWAGFRPGAFVGLSEFQPFFTQDGPPVPEGDVGIEQTVLDMADRGARLGDIARLYAWGPRSGDWEHLARWQVRWVWPFGGWPDVRSTATAAAPYASLDAARHALGIGPVTPVLWTTASGDDPSHALLLARHAATPVETDVLALEADHPPLVVRRADGEALGELEAAVRTGGRWYLASVQAPGELPATVVWLVDGSNAREIARVPRAGFEGSRPTTRLARRSDGRAIGLVVDGQPLGTGGAAQERWVLPIDLESSTLGEPEPVGPVNFAGRKLDPCGAASPMPTSWILDAPLPVAVHVTVAGTEARHLSGAFGRLELTRDGSCVEALTGSLDGTGVQPGALSRPGGNLGARPSDPTLTLAAVAARQRFPLRCVAK